MKKKKKKEVLEAVAGSGKGEEDPRNQTKL
jgi:hypothetical protein